MTVLLWLTLLTPNAPSTGTVMCNPAEISKWVESKGKLRDAPKAERPLVALEIMVGGCPEPYDLAVAARDVRITAPEDRLRQSVKLAISTLPELFKRACPAGAAALERAASLSPAERGPSLYRDCELKRFGHFEGRVSLLGADESHPIFAIIYAQMGVETGVPPALMGQVISAMIGAPPDSKPAAARPQEAPVTSPAGASPTMPASSPTSPASR